MKNRSINNMSALFKITSRCNQSCNFCAEMPLIEQGRQDLSLDEIKENYNYLSRKIKIDSIILSGGEPTLHPDYFSILDFFAEKNASLKLITNLTRFNDLDFLRRHSKIFEQQNNWQVYGSINRILSDDSALNFSGLRNVLFEKMKISLIVTAYKDNLKEVPDLIKALNELFVLAKVKFNLELRLVYIEEVCDAVIDQAPKDFFKVKEVFDQSLRFALALNISLVLWNFPVCYLQQPNFDFNHKLNQRIERCIIKVDKDSQGIAAKVRSFEQFFYKTKECQNCLYFQSCSGINRKYIESFNFPELKSIR